jgi:hypothetical protein
MNLLFIHEHIRVVIKEKKKKKQSDVYNKRLLGEHRTHPEKYYANESLFIHAERAKERERERGLPPDNNH